MFHQTCSTFGGSYPDLLGESRSRWNVGLNQPVEKGERKLAGSSHPEAESIPDYLGLVGDAADGIPGIPKWGAKTAGLVLSHYGHIESIPSDAKDWEVAVRGAAGIAASLAGRMDDALFYRQLATLRLDVGLDETLDDLKWRGINREVFEKFCADIGITENIRPNEWKVE